VLFVVVEPRVLFSDLFVVESVVELRDFESTVLLDRVEREEAQSPPAFKSPAVTPSTWAVKLSNLALMFSIREAIERRDCSSTASDW
jgi:hypothetical protein